MSLRLIICYNCGYVFDSWAPKGLCLITCPKCGNNMQFYFGFDCD